MSDLPFLGCDVSSPSVPFEYNAFIIHPPTSPTRATQPVPLVYADSAQLTPHSVDARDRSEPPSENTTAAPNAQQSPPHTRANPRAGRSGNTRPRTGNPPHVREKPGPALRASHLRRKRRGTLEVPPHAASSLVIFPPQPRAASLTSVTHTQMPLEPPAVEREATQSLFHKRKRRKRGDPQGFLEKVQAQCQHIQQAARQLQLQYNLLKTEEEALYQLRRHFEALPLDDPYWTSLEFKHYSKTPLTPNEATGLDPHLLMEDASITSPSLFSTLPLASSLLDMETVGSMEDEEPVFDFNAFWDVSPNDPFFFPPA